VRDATRVVAERLRDGAVADHSLWHDARAAVVAVPEVPVGASPERQHRTPATRAVQSLDRHATYIVATFIAGASQ
jgi:hypothetical protein